ncbi:bifunctional heptose 7-phosphate kinase/heptose 1-phosphate adenyltransferase [Agromyces sp. Marseille-P2726]|uniref:bifunctional heptose 7-phosphate kinase/heptose 1-phosphate adenyltransferase n=1 Tax=Agromyces sp. Marseille-P2726 TaxID=2709132 RepID=UPI00156DE7DF|nr:PfkB family carbohydrate kinase [Agromyces sp. Marseille-P2726]
MNPRILVLGDVLLDVDLAGGASRLSPDGPVPVVDVTERVERAGGAGLVATFLAADGAEVTLATAIAEDARGQRIRTLLHGVRLAAAELAAPTPTKTRVHAGAHPVARIDEGCGAPGRIRRMSVVIEEIRTADLVVAADYGRGLLAGEQVRTALARRAEDIPIVWDPHPRGTSPVPGCRLVTPNRAEAAGIEGIAVDDARHALDVAADLRVRWNARCVAVTLDADGAAVALDDGSHSLLPTRRVQVTDSCGAGDRLASAAALQLASGAPVLDAVRSGVALATDFLEAGGVAALPRHRAGPFERRPPLAAVG